MVNLINHRTGMDPADKQTAKTSHRFSERTRRNLNARRNETDTFASYKSDIRIFEQWRLQTGRSGLPNVEDICDFLSDQAAGVLSAVNRSTGELVGDGINDVKCVSLNTLNRRRWALMAAFKRSNIKLSEDDMVFIEDTIAGIKISPDNGAPLRRRGKASPVMPEHVGAMIRCEAMQRQPQFKRLRDQAILAMMLVTGARKSEILGKNGILVGGITFTAKALQFKRMILKQGSRERSFTGSVPYSASKYSAFQIIKRYHDFVSKLPNVSDTSPFFIRSTRAGKPNPNLAGVGTRMLGDWLYKYAVSANLPDEVVDRIKGHSIRVGAIVYLYDLGTDKRRIAEITGQSESTIERYAKQRTNMSYDGGL